MARPATGRIVIRKRANGRKVYALRFSAYGQRQYVTLPDGTTSQQAEQALEKVLAEVKLGIWQPAQPEQESERSTDPTFHQFASEWLDAKRHELRPSTEVDYRWQLVNHLLPYFADKRLSQITVAEVDRYKTAKLRESEEIAERLKVGTPRMIDGVDHRGREYSRPERPLSKTSINKTITRLGQILEMAVQYDEYEITRNPARGKDRKLKASKPAAVYLDRADQIEALLSAAGELDARARPDRRHIPRQTMLAVLAFGGLRLGEMLSLRWRDVELAAGRLYVGDAKTDAGVRHVELLPALRESLTTYKLGCSSTGPDDLVFPTSSGCKHSRDNVRDRVFAPALKLANERRETAGLPPLPRGMTPHKLRHTCCSLLFAVGYELPRVMGILGHADETVTLRIYAHVMNAETGERDGLRALVMGETLEGFEDTRMDSARRVRTQR